MSADHRPSSYPYQEALAPLARMTDDERLRKQISEVLALLDFNSTLNQSLERSEILDLVVYVAMGETRASWAGVLLRDPQAAEARLSPAARRGRNDSGWGELAFEIPGVAPRTASAEDEGIDSWSREVLSASRAALLVPMVKSERLVGVLLLGERAEPYGADERLFAESLCVSAAAAIDNLGIYEELRRLNRRLSFKVYQLNSLFDITRELNRSPDVARVRNVLVTNAMGHVLTTRALLLHEGAVVEQRGLKLAFEDRAVLENKEAELGVVPEDRRVEDLAPGELRDLLARIGMDLIVPLRSGETVHGVLLLGARASGTPLADEDREFLRYLASQGAAALDNLRLTREWIEKQKIEKEMALAREIQRGLLPDESPEIEGWDIAGINIPTLTVGGDYFDYLERGGSRHWVVVADVSGKGTGAALLMAAVRTALHTLAGLGEIPLQSLAERLNELVYASTEVNRYVTAFFASLDAESGEMAFVNAGHCYPILMRRDGGIERLIEGGPVIGILPELEVSQGYTRLEPGDLLVLYTDGLSETQSPEGEEYGEDRILDSMRAWMGRPSREIVARLVSGVRVFAAEAGLSDDLTLVVVQRT